MTESQQMVSTSIFFGGGGGQTYFDFMSGEHSLYTLHVFLQVSVHELEDQEQPPFAWDTIT